MGHEISRRQVLQGLAIGSAIVGFNPLTRLWVSEARADNDPFLHVPPLDGQLLTDPASRSAVSTDAGQLVFATPRAVLKPGSVADIQQMIRFCRRNQIPVAARGQAHTAFGQGLVANGLLIEMATLNKIHSITDDTLVVDGGAVWKDILAQTTRQNLTPAMLTSFQGLSVGGTLSVGGVSGMSHNRGTQVDHVLELKVVDGRGELITCSARQNPALFNAVLTGVGQCAIIVEATVRLVSVGTNARYTVLTYPDQATWMRDIRTLVSRGELDSIWGSLRFDPGQGRFLYEINGASFYTPPAAPSATLYRDLGFDPALVRVTEMTYYGFQTMVDDGIDFLKSIGLWYGVTHPWYDIFIGDSKIDSYVSQIVPTLDPIVDVGYAGFVLLFPIHTALLKRPLLRVPNEPLVFLFDVLTSANVPGVDPNYNDAMLRRNRRWFELGRGMGGVKYNIAAIPFSRADWKQQYGPLYEAFELEKSIHDPAGILTPGPAIF